MDHRPRIMDPFSGFGDETMKRAILIALGIGVIMTSAAALDLAGPRPVSVPAVQNDSEVHAARTRVSARAEQRARIEERWLADRERCASLGGYRRDKCLVQAHATKGRAMLEAAAPYETRF
jgi:hypothetical protein